MVLPQEVASEGPSATGDDRRPGTVRGGGSCAGRGGTWWGQRRQPPGPRWAPCRVHPGVPGPLLGRRAGPPSDQVRAGTAAVAPLKLDLGSGPKQATDTLRALRVGRTGVIPKPERDSGTACAPPSEPAPPPRGEILAKPADNS